MEAKNAAAWKGCTAPPAKMLCRYGGRIRLRTHDDQLSYVGGDTKILRIGRSVRFAAVHARLASLDGSAPDKVCFKYQLPGDDLYVLVSVTNDEDLDHMMVEYDRLLRSTAKPVPHFRVFVFRITPPQPPNPSAEPKSDWEWFVDTLNSVPAINSMAVGPSTADSVRPAPPVMAVTAGTQDYLFGLDKDLMLPRDVKIKEPALVETILMEPLMRSDPMKEVQPIKGDQAKIQHHTQVLHGFQIVEGSEKTAVSTTRFPQNGSDKVLVRAYPEEYHIQPCVQEKGPSATPPASSHPQVPPPAATYWVGPLSVASTSYVSVASGNHSTYLIPAAPRAYSIAEKGYHVMIPRAVVKDGLYCNTPVVYSVAPLPLPQLVTTQATPMVVGTYMAFDVVMVHTQPMVEAPVYTVPQVVYDSTRWVMYYATGAVPTYQTVVSASSPPSS